VDAEPEAVDAGRTLVAAAVDLRPPVVSPSLGTGTGTGTEALSSQDGAGDDLAVSAAEETVVAVLVGPHGARLLRRYGDLLVRAVLGPRGEGWLRWGSSFVRCVEQARRASQNSGNGHGDGDGNGNDHADGNVEGTQGGAGAETLAALLDAVVAAAATDQRTQRLLPPDAASAVVHAVLAIYVPDTVATPSESSSSSSSTSRPSSSADRAAAAGDMPLQLLDIDCRLPPPLRNATLRARMLHQTLHALRTSCADAGARDDRAKALHYDAQAAALRAVPYLLAGLSADSPRSTHVDAEEDDRATVRQVPRLPGDLHRCLPC